MNVKTILKNALFSIIVLSVKNSYSQDSLSVKQDKKDDGIKTIFGKTKSHGGYLGLSCDYTQLNNNDGIMMGGQLGWIINHSFVIGVAGYGFMSDYVDYSVDNYPQISGGYGGLYFESIVFPKFPVHVSFPVLLGVGGATSYSSFTNDDWSYYADDSDAFLVAEPGVNIELNMLKFFKIAFGAKYRFTSELYMPNIDKEALNGLSAGITLKFGKF